MSIFEKEFDDVIEAMKFLEEIAFGPEDCIFRGHKDISYRLQTSLFRFTKIPHESWKSDIDELIDIFRVGLVKIGKVPFEKNDRHNWLEYARHHGVPTPCLDFTFSPYVALFFAFNGVKPNVSSSKEKDHVVINALNIHGLAHAWASIIHDPKKDYESFMKLHNQFLYPNYPLFQGKFPAHTLQLVKFPSRHNIRMQRQQGALLYDTLDYPRIGFIDLEDFIEKIREPDIHLPDKTIVKGKPTLIKVKFRKSDIGLVLERLELMGISGGMLLFQNEDGVAMDVINSSYYIPKTMYMRDIKFSEIDETES